MKDILIFIAGIVLYNLIKSVTALIKKKQEPIVIVNAESDDLDAIKHHISHRLSAHLRELQQTFPHYFFIALQGSQNYGLDEYDNEYRSDVDSKAVILLSFHDICLGVAPISACLKLNNGEQIDVKDIREMAKQWKKANISYLELLYSKYIIVNPRYKKEFQMLMDNRDKIVAAHLDRLVKSIYGMSLEKQKALCHPYPTIKDKIDKFGFDGKQLSHCCRLYYFLTDIYYDVGIRELDFKSYYRLNGYKRRKKVLMNYKKQLDEKGNIMSAERAKSLCDAYVKNNKEMVDLILEQTYEENSDKILDEIVCDVMKKNFDFEMKI